MSITACYTDQWKEWWMNPNGVELYQFMAKDNVPFHSIMFPASLIGTGSDYTLAKCISSTEYLNFENDKFSKSRQVGIFGDDAVTSGISSDIYRFYLLLIRPETQDTSFHWNDFIIKVNSELVNNIGNFIYRTLTFTKNNHNSQVPIVTITNKDSQLMDEINNELKQYIDLMEGMKLRDALKCVLKISQIGNMYLQSNEPWKTIKYDSQRAGTVIGLCLNIVHVISVIISPYMPMTSSDIMHQLNVVNDDCYSDVINDAMMSSLILQPGHVIGEPHLLFAKLQDSFVDNKN
jgi:methionyl-tRNA synthetase